MKKINYVLDNSDLIDFQYHPYYKRLKNADLESLIWVMSNYSESFTWNRDITMYNTHMNILYYLISKKIESINFS